jgi:hypothetical protein
VGLIYLVLTSVVSLVASVAERHLAFVS